MEAHFHKIPFQKFASLEDLPGEDIELFKAAQTATKKSYAPYSKFKVGAALLLENGEIITGANQENMAYPSGLCAERVVAYAAQTQYPGVALRAMAVAALDEHGAWVDKVSSCGACRQSLLEFEVQYGNEIKMIFPYGAGGEIMVVPSIKAMLPFHFSF